MKLADATALFLGSTAVDRVYAGAEMVWSSTPPEPVDYPPTIRAAGGVGPRTGMISVSGTFTIHHTASYANLVDGGYVTNNSEAIYLDSASGHVLFDFGPGPKQKISRFALAKNSATSTGSFKWQGSNDGDEWLDLTAAANTNRITVFWYATENEGFYRYFRLIHTAGGTSIVPWLLEALFTLQSEFPAAPIETPASYSTIFSIGDRRPLIDISTTAAMASGDADGFFLLNGSPAGNNGYWNSGQSGREIVFDFGEPVFLEEIRWVQSNSLGHGSWGVQRWVGGAWVDASSPVTLGTTSGSIIPVVAADAPCQRYRLLQLSGTTSNSPWLRQMEFKVGLPGEPPAHGVPRLHEYDILARGAQQHEVTKLNRYSVLALGRAQHNVTKLSTYIIVKEP